MKSQKDDKAESLDQDALMNMNEANIEYTQRIKIQRNAMFDLLLNHQNKKTPQQNHFFSKTH